MIVNKPIGAVKTKNKISRLTVGKQVPEVVLKHWKETKQLKKLLELGIIIDEKKKEKVNDSLRQDKSGQSENSE